MKRTKHIDLDLMRKGFTRRFIKGPLAVGLLLSLWCHAVARKKLQWSVRLTSVPPKPVNLVECEAAYQKAQAEAERTGPKYNSNAQCESEFGGGQCTAKS